jgi:phosphoribosylamine-glycine ligase
MVFGIGAFTQGVMRCLRDEGAWVSAYLTRNYGHYGPNLEGPTYSAKQYSSPISALRRERPEFIVPMSIEWALQPWTAAFLTQGIPILCPTGEGLLLERDRDFASDLCRRYRIPFPRSYRVGSRSEAQRLLKRRPRPYVIKNPLCSPFSPVHTIACERPDETRAWLDVVDDREGLFLQEYLGRTEVGHIALVSDGQVYSLVTNQEYKRAFDGNQGIVAGAPMGGLVERDPYDRYGLARSLLHPLRPWFRRVGFNGPVQVTAILHRGRWHVLEYNVRLGVTSAPLILRLLANPLTVLRDASFNRPLSIRFRPRLRFGASITLAGYGYPYVRLNAPPLPVTLRGRVDGDVWWNEVAEARHSGLVMTGHRIADVTAVGPTLSAALKRAYRSLRQIHCLGSYHRQDIGHSLWPPGSA